MKFYPWVTDYELYCRDFGKKSRISYADFLISRGEEMIDNGTPPFRLLMEYDWTNDGRPYYNVHPRLVTQLSRINLSKIPSHLLVVPDPFSSIHISFAEPCEELTLSETMKVDSGTWEKMCEAKDLPAGSSVQGLMMTRSPNSKQDLWFCLDFGVNTDEGHPSYIVLQMPLSEDKNLSEALEDTIVNKPGNHKDVCANALRIAATIGFMANSNSELIEPDVLAKLRSKYRDGNKAKRQQIVVKSQRRGKLGFNVGNDMMFFGEKPMMGGGGRSTGMGGELQYQHLRGGHPHAVRYGEGKRLVKIMWFQPTQVRPDLTFKPESER